MNSFPVTFAIMSMVAILTGKTVTGSPVKYDQRQEGDLNVRTDVEDVVFVVVPPKDFITAGMGLVAATAADLLRKNYGGIGPERWPQRTSSKLGFVPVEKSPYKIDLERSEIQVKKISQAGDPNRYNIQETRTPIKIVQEVVMESSTEVPVKPMTETVVEKVDEMLSTTEGKTVKKDLKSGVGEMKEQMMEEMKSDKTDAKFEKMSKPEMEMMKTDAKMEKISKPEMDMKKTDMKLEKVSKPEMEMKKTDTKLEKISKPEMEMKKTDAKLEKISKPAGEMKKPDMKLEKISKPEMEMKKTGESITPEAPMVIGEFSEDPTSIFRLEGCGPDAYRDSTGKCVIKMSEKGSN